MRCGGGEVEVSLTNEAEKLFSEGLALEPQWQPRFYEKKRAVLCRAEDKEQVFGLHTSLISCF